MNSFVGLILLAIVAASLNGCSSSSSAQSGPVLQPVLASGVRSKHVTPNSAGAAIFWLDTSASGYEPWFSDGTGTSAIQLADIVPGPGRSDCNSFNPSIQIAFAGPYFYFWADDGVNGCEVWRTNGTPAGTALFADTIPGPAGFDSAGDLVVGGNNLYLSGQRSDTLAVEIYVINLN